MKNFPKFINNKQDVENLLTLYPVETKKYLQSLVDTKDDWFPTGLSATAEKGITDAIHKVVEDKDTDGIITFEQYELREDENGAIFRLGFSSVDEAKSLVTALEKTISIQPLDSN